VVRVLLCCTVQDFIHDNELFDYCREPNVVKYVMDIIGGRKPPAGTAKDALTSYPYEDDSSTVVGIHTMCAVPPQSHVSARTVLIGCGGVAAGAAAALCRWCCTG
jgi:hypothetical protein